MQKRMRPSPIKFSRRAERERSASQSSRTRNRPLSGLSCTKVATVPRLPQCMKRPLVAEVPVRGYGAVLSGSPRHCANACAGRPCRIGCPESFTKTFRVRRSSRYCFIGESGFCAKTRSEVPDRICCSRPIFRASVKNVSSSESAPTTTVSVFTERSRVNGMPSFCRSFSVFPAVS